jgi:hypothetical protein
LAEFLGNPLGDQYCHPFGIFDHPRVYTHARRRCAMVFDSYYANTPKTHERILELIDEMCDDADVIVATRPSPRLGPDTIQIMIRRRGTPMFEPEESSGGCLLKSYKPRKDSQVVKGMGEGPTGSVSPHNLGEFVMIRGQNACSGNVAGREPRDAL